ncbi:hypothetical protein J4219_08715 [Candidatus Woesearchaeota archaeon]|nr:hypothetical protein [Candidatus Woesearchaeota archaeon]
MTDKKPREPRKPFDYFAYPDCELPRDCRFGINYDLRLGPYSDLTPINIKIKKHNIAIDVEIPQNCALLVPPRRTFFSLENLSRSEHPNYQFTTRYKHIDNLQDAVPVKRTYNPAELLGEFDKTQNPEKTMELYVQLLRELIGKDTIDTLADIVSINKFAEDSLQQDLSWGRGLKTAEELLDQFRQTGKYEGLCKERTTMVKWLLCAGSADNRTHTMVYTGKNYDDLAIHTFNEIRMNKNEERFPCPSTGITSKKYANAAIHSPSFEKTRHGFIT